METNQENQPKIDKNKCVGCSACYSICPQNAISFSVDQDGFSYPKIDYSKCIHCHLCDLVCPYKEVSENNATFEYYAATSRSKKGLAKSSSGGIFPLLTNYLLSINGVIYGAAFEDHFQLRHLKITNEDQTERLQGSKYLQSDLTKNHIFPDVAKNLQCGNPVLFSGTPCQCKGLSLYLKYKKINTEKLYLISLVCHGVPSQTLFNSYIKYLEKHMKSSAASFSFRDKTYGWNDPAFFASFQNGKTYLRKDLFDPYCRLFLNSITLRSSCYRCNSKANESCDLFLGDFWGVEKIYPQLYNKDGVSLIGVATQKGRDLITAIGNSLDIQQIELPANYLEQHHIFSSNSHENTSKRNLSSFTSENLLRKSIKITVPKITQRPLIKSQMEIKQRRKIKTEQKTACIITIDDPGNYGNRLQNLALQVYLEKTFQISIKTLIPKDVIGKKALVSYLLKETPKKILIPFLAPWSKGMRKAWAFSRFNKNIHKSRAELSLRGYQVSLNERFDYFIVGSDQIWNSTFSKNMPLNLLTFAPCKKRLSYAASIVNYSPSPANFSLFVTELPKFSLLSLRERDAISFGTQLGKQNPMNNIDPVFLLSRQEWLKIASDHLSRALAKRLEKPFIFFYWIGKKDEAIFKSVREFAAKKSLGIVFIWNGDTKECRKVGDFSFSPFDFLNALIKSNSVITNSFHGTALSILFGKPFISLPASGKKDSRFDNLTSLFSIPDVMFSFSEFPIALNPSTVNEVLQKEREKTFQTLCVYFQPKIKQTSANNIKNTVS